MYLIIKADRVPKSGNSFYIILGGKGENQLLLQLKQECKNHFLKKKK